MYRMLVATAALAASCVTAAAADPATAGRGWDGLTIGVVGALATGQDDWPGDGTYDLDEAGFGGAFLTWNHQAGDVVYGVDVQAQFGRQEETDYPDFFYTAFYDIDGRIGYAHDAALLYAAGGLTVAGIEEDGDAYARAGFNLGVGIDYKLDDNIILGAAYTYRSISADCEPHDQPFTLTGHAVQFRLGLRL